WIFMGSLLATYGMAKGWVEFWLIWVAVDLVGVPLLFSAGYYASGLMYVFYGAFTLVGFFVWWRVNSNQRKRATIETGFPDLHLKMGDDSK
ncbi:MAG: nicotinamide mononucleotide transporter family protein, partial [Kocuria sp.]|nr:nicotinamide mononucleotide transporter family protein [Kocuria sp.]